MKGIISVFLLYDSKSVSLKGAIKHPEERLEAKNIEEAKKIIKKKHCNVKIFSAFDEKGNLLFTEKDI